MEKNFRDSGWQYYGLALPTAGFLGMSRALPATEPPVMEQTEATEETIPEPSEVPESDMETETAQEIVEENSFNAKFNINGYD